MKLILTAIVFCLLFAPGARAWDENHCFWNGIEMHCRHGWIWRDHREWPEEWRERARHREHERYEHEVR
jgi:hypothetical protein